MLTGSENRPIVVAGPCSAESRSQLKEVVELLATNPRVSAIRVGVWKPRTRPGGFEGLGTPALSWMQELQAKYRKPLGCEVAKPNQVELCLQHGINLLWIGARTVANPFMVDELCAALRGTGASVLVKNPVCPDVRLWIGAFERLQQVGIEDVAAVHRGFAMYRNEGYRNAPLWEVALELRRELPQVPILCDPSHMGGRRELVSPLATTAMQLDYDGLMVEVHPHPDEALTDAEQQITPTELEELLNRLYTRHSSPSELQQQRIEALRSGIDMVDGELLRVLERRMILSRQIGRVKHEADMSVYQGERWNALMEDRLRQAQELGLDTDFVKEIMDKIHAESVRVQL